MLALDSLVLAYIDCWRLARRVELYILYRVARADPKLLSTFKKIIARAFIKRQSAKRMTSALYRQQGYGLGE